jgi:hypothetical protein
MTNDVLYMLDALYDGTMTLDEVAQRFRRRSWPHRRRPQPTSYLEMAAAEMEDPDPYIPGSYDDVVAAYDRGRLTDAQYAVLVEAIAESRRAEDAKEAGRDQPAQ